MYNMHSRDVSSVFRVFYMYIMCWHGQLNCRVLVPTCPHCPATGVVGGESPTLEICSQFGCPMQRWSQSLLPVLLLWLFAAASEGFLLSSVRPGMKLWHFEGVGCSKLLCCCCCGGGGGCSEMRFDGLFANIKTHAEYSVLSPCFTVLPLLGVPQIGDPHKTSKHFCVIWKGVHVTV